MKKEFRIFAVIVLLCMFSVSSADAITWTTLDCPGVPSGGYQRTQIFDISGSKVLAADFWNNTYIYDGSTWTQPMYPGSTSTCVTSIDGDSMAGIYTDSLGDHNFLYDGAGWRTLDVPVSADYPLFGPPGYIPIAVDGGNVLINSGSDSPHFYIYDGQTSIPFTTPVTKLLPGPAGTMNGILTCGIEGSSVFGLGGDYKGFIYNYQTQSLTTLAFKGTPLPTVIRGISGDNIVGYYGSGGIMRGFLYDGANWTRLAFPGAMQTLIYGIDGDRIAGAYYLNGYHGFIATIPEPATILLLGVGAAVLRKRKSV